MGSHDRGAFGELLDRLEKTGATDVSFELVFARPEGTRWRASVGLMYATGRTGEEALRRLVEHLEGCAARVSDGT